MTETLLLVEDDEVFAGVLSRALQRDDFDVTVINDLDDLRDVLDQSFRYVLLDLMVNQQSSLPQVAPLRRNYPDATIVMLTGYASIATTVQALRDGADNYLAKPVGARDIVAVLRGEGEPGSIATKPIPLNRVEWEHIQRVLAENDGNVSATAKALGVHRRTLQRKLAKRPPP